LPFILFIPPPCKITTSTSAHQGAQRLHH
jgi:hypothetical protein